MQINRTNISAVLLPYSAGIKVFEDEEAQLESTVKLSAAVYEITSGPYLESQVVILSGIVRCTAFDQNS